MLEGERTAAIQLLMRGTNTGSFAGVPPTGAAVALPTAHFPAATSFTRLDMGSRAGLLRLRRYAGPVLAAMATMKSVIGSAIFNDGESVGYTVSAWSSPEAAAEILRQDEHRTATRAFFSDGLGVSGWTSVSVPPRFNALWVRCETYGTMVDAESADRCTCGESLPESPPYF